MSQRGFRFIVTHAGTRLDRLVADETGEGRRIVRRWLRDGQVRVNGHIAAASDMPREGSEIIVEDRPLAGDADTRPLRVLYENERHVVVFKPAGLHCERGKSAGSIAGLLEHRYGDLSAIGERAEEAGLVHRIDRDTSGVLVGARTGEEYRRLRAAFRAGDSEKTYLALCAGELRAAVEIDLPLARRAAHVVPAGPHDADGDVMDAWTLVEPLDCGDEWTLVLATMRTGVTHQIRAHMAAAGHPLIGDALYGGPELAGASRRGQLLHALRIRIGNDVDASAAPAADFTCDYARLRRAAR